MTEERKKSEVKNEVRNVERKEKSRLAKMNVYVVEERKCTLIFYSRGLIKQVTYEYSKTCAATETEKEGPLLDILIFVNNWWLCDIFLLDIFVYFICYTSFLKVLIS
jgi:hypothetical protein